MSEAQHHPGFGESYDSADQVLAALHSHHQVVNTAEIAKLELAIRWAVMHPAESITHGAATVEGTEGELAIAGPGAPLVAEFCVADLALALGMSTDAGRTYLGDALELRYRLPKLWAVVTTGRVPVWRARKIAHATKTLCPEAAAYVDRHLAHQAHRCSYAQIDRAVTDALRLYDPAEADKRRREAADARHFDIDTNQVSFDGTVHVDADLDLADALDLDDAITAGAAQLGRLGCDESLDVRRSLAAGALARRDLTLDLQTDPADVPAHRPSPRKRELMIYLHLSDRALEGAVAGVENTRSAISVDQVKDWCHGTNTHVTIRPVIDLNDNLRCSRPARSADLDHVVEPERGGPTDSVNLAALCRGHHRYKTHGGWTVVRTGPTTFTWTSRYGYTYDWDTRHAQHTRHPH
ncbi:HNH endonuclease signature motif containing protein [Nocardioides endophyticus]|uniref:HNH endonuclease signature motif containing protein n=1 Tax=Nocardioides endophyticus TaxID=1353775 RepID=A0ABP8ZJD2_9ACTN